MGLDGHPMVMLLVFQEVLFCDGSCEAPQRGGPQQASAMRSISAACSAHRTCVQRSEPASPHREVIAVVVGLDGQAHQLACDVVELVAGLERGAAAGQQQAVDDRKPAAR